MTSWPLAILSRGSLVTVKPSEVHIVREVHSLVVCQKLRVVMFLPSGPSTYDRDAVVLDAGDGRPPIILWAAQVEGVAP